MHSQIHLLGSYSLTLSLSFSYKSCEYCVLVFVRTYRFKEHVEVMFSEDSRPAWDKDHHYTPDNIQVCTHDDGMLLHYIFGFPKHFTKAVFPKAIYSH